jgi:biopolymer transport protein ExbD
VPAHSHRKVILPATRGKKKLSFALTPLADAMFQLLIFFMLSSSLAPYSLITLAPGAAAQTAPAPTGAAAAQPTIWHLGAGSLRAGTETVPLGQIGEMIDKMRTAGSDHVVIFTDASATVQDVATVLNRVTLAHVGSVQLISAQGG